MISEIIGLGLGLVKKVLASILSLLPTSPFRSVIDGLEFGDWLGWLNWFVPIGTLLTISALWLGAIGVFFLWSIILRWVRAIK